MTTEKIVIEKRLEANLNRIASLLAIYDVQARGRGRRSVAATDVLRAAVVLLHASLEDLFRSVLATALRRLKVADTALVAHQQDLTAMMARRHLIAHRADVNNALGSAHHSTRSLDRETVIRWIKAVGHFGRAFLRQL